MTQAPCTQRESFAVAQGSAEKRTLWVTGITLATMVGEITVGYLSNSMALTADGWHMGTHAFALGLASLTYYLARRYAGHPRFAFGTWKIEVLGGYTSALFLLAVALVMAVESTGRLLTPPPVAFGEALLVAVLGLLVNLACAKLLGGDHHAGHDHGHHGHHDHHGNDHHGHPPHEHGACAGHDHCTTSGGQEGDLNLRAAYLHVLADAATSVAAILALLGGYLYGWNWLDPLMGLIGGIIVALWAVGLIRDTAHVLLDSEMHHPVVDQVVAAIDAAREHPARLRDLHVWRVGRGLYAVILGLEVADSVEAAYYREALSGVPQLGHVTIELYRDPPR